MEYVGGGGVRAMGHVSGDWRTMLWNEFSLSSFTKVLEIKLKSLEQTHQMLFIR